MKYIISLLLSPSALTVRGESQLHSARNVKVFVDTLIEGHIPKWDTVGTHGKYLIMDTASDWGHDIGWFVFYQQKQIDSLCRTMELMQEVNAFNIYITNRYIRETDSLLQVIRKNQKP